jgi:hypothetical protein
MTRAATGITTIRYGKGLSFIGQVVGGGSAQLARTHDQAAGRMALAYMGLTDRWRTNFDIPNRWFIHPCRGLGSGRHKRGRPNGSVVPWFRGSVAEAAVVATFARTSLGGGRRSRARPSRRVGIATFVRTCWGWQRTAASNHVRKNVSGAGARDGAADIEPSKPKRSGIETQRKWP